MFTPPELSSFADAVAGCTALPFLGFLVLNASILAAFPLLEPLGLCFAFDALALVDFGFSVTAVTAAAAEEEEEDDDDDEAS